MRVSILPGGRGLAAGGRVFLEGGESTASLVQRVRPDDARGLQVAVLALVDVDSLEVSVEQSADGSAWSVVASWSLSVGAHLLDLSAVRGPLLRARFFAKPTPGLPGGEAEFDYALGVAGDGELLVDRTGIVTVAPAGAVARVLEDPEEVARVAGVSVGFLELWGSGPQGPARRTRVAPESAAARAVAAVAVPPVGLAFYVREQAGPPSRAEEE